MKRNNLTIASILVVVCLALMTFAQTPTRLQVAAVTEQSKAESVAKEIEQLGYGPAEIRSAGNFFKVLTRAYDSYAEANFEKDKIRAAGFKDTFAVKEDAAIEKAVFGDASPKDQTFKASRTKIDFQKNITTSEKYNAAPDYLKSINNDPADEPDLFNKAVGLYQTNDTDEAVATLDA
ncbi:MAG: SPOR domain-containing protein, partial [Candidatus Sumerlaeota bacterium]|nr:SPOR domain-containing protein [Candidatus Sumerlaeota bacterium]